MLREPREASKKEKEEAVQFLIPRTDDVSTYTIRNLFATVPMVGFLSKVVADYIFSFTTCAKLITFLCK